MVCLLGKDSVRYEFCELRVELTNKANQALLGVSFSVVNRGDQPHQRSISAVQPDSIDHHPDLACIFAGDNPASALVPVKNEPLIGALGHQVFVDFDRRTTRMRK